MKRLNTGGAAIDRSQEISFRWNGKRTSGFAGDTIVSALAGSGIDVFSRSMKYHRPRGVMTADFWDPNCSFQVGDEPNVRGAHRLISDAIDVSAQNVWPSLERDFMAVNSLVGRFLTAGFYYKTFMAPSRLWPVYEKVLAKFAPGGTVDWKSEPGLYTSSYLHPDVVVVGGGPAGLSAATAAAREGAEVLVVEHDHGVGGHLRWGTDSDRAVATELEGEALAAGVQILTDSTATGWYEGAWLAINQRTVPTAGVVEKLIRCRAKTTVLAPGLMERPYVFAGNDMVGVMLAGAARRLVNLYGVLPGERAVVFTANAEGELAAADLEAAGASVTLVDARTGATLHSAEGSRNRLEKVVFGDGTEIEADLLVTSTGWTAPTSLANMAGDKPEYDDATARFFPTERLESASAGHVMATGGLAGDGSLEQLLVHGADTGRAAAARALTARNQMRAATARADRSMVSEVPDAEKPAALGRQPHLAMFRAETHGLVDFSEDIGSKDLLGAATEGFDSVELLKRFSTVTMGPTQGKLSTVNSVAVLAEHHGQTIGEVGTTVWRPPFAPISLGALAGHNFAPHRGSSIQSWHESNAMVPLHAGQWVRPDHYGDPQGEAANVRSNVGIIDVTPLGKLDLKGANVPDLLELIYVNKWRKLAIGAVRYGVMVGEDGIVMDDGVTAHLGEDHYLMTTTSSGAASVWEWIENWLQTERPEWDVVVTPVTTAYTSINVAGPNSRELIARLCADVELTESAFPYMNVRTGTVAGVADCIMWRIGFTGELSYEIHVPAGYGRHVWDALLADGADLGVRAFGVEGQRILRLEKGHFIVGQDTDALTRAVSAGIGGLVKLDKADTIGKPELAWAAERSDAPQLVTVLTDDGSQLPSEASQILGPDRSDGRPNILGRITSSRMSPALGRSICLAQVHPSVAGAGSRLSVLLIDGSRIGAVVHDHHAFVDPEGERMYTDEETSIEQQSRGRANTRRGGPAGFASPVHAPGSLATVSITDETNTAKIVMRSATSSLDIDFGTSRRDGDTLLVGSRPGEWMAFGPLSKAGELTEALRPGPDSKTIDLTHGRAMLRVSGEASRDLLSHVCNVDFADDFTPDGAAFGAYVAGVMCDLVRDDVDGATSYLIHCDRSFGHWLSETLGDLAGRVV
ncbi:MAG: FAD-dependent oxidoreductase [Actinomycetia bacterium]|nr:FAD-dependent oxidoreductase [Actinomycetes bacterium]MCP4960089.1 FAD-dependent oxidoreductase [Actinomycetes bacterium]